jgi:SLIT-ROBO Rho GTPase activating protein
VYPSEDESDNFEATAQFDFAARSDRELSLKKGDNVVLFNQVSTLHCDLMGESKF